MTMKQRTYERPEVETILLHSEFCILAASPGSNTGGTGSVAGASRDPLYGETSDLNKQQGPWGEELPSQPGNDLWN